MNIKKVVPLGGALILGLVSAYMVVRVLHGKQNTQAAGPKLVKVVMAAKDVPAGQDLIEDTVSVGQILADSAPRDTFADPSEVVGRVPSTPLVKGQTIVESLLAPKGSGSGLQAIIPAGMRAVTIDINEVSGIAGFVTSGSRVDIVQTFHDNLTNQPIGRYLVQNVEVTAVGTRAQSGLDGQEARSVTLLVTPQQAQAIELASTNGRPRLVLRNGRDQKTSEMPTLTLADLTGVPLALPEPPAPVHAVSTVDLFAPTTRPAAPPQAATEDWKIRIITAGEPSLVDVRPNQAPAHAATTAPSETGIESRTESKDVSVP